MSPSDFTETTVETTTGFLKTFYYKDMALLQVHSWGQSYLRSLANLRLKRHAEAYMESPFEVRSNRMLTLTHMIPSCIRELSSVAEIAGKTPELYISGKKVPLLSAGGTGDSHIKSVVVHRNLEQYMGERPSSTSRGVNFYEIKQLSGSTELGAAIFSRFAYSLGFTRQALKEFTGDYYALAVLCRFAISYYVGTGRNAEDKDSAQRMRKCFRRVINMDTYVSQCFFSSTSHKYMADLDAGVYNDVPDDVLRALLAHAIPVDDYYGEVMEFMRTLEAIKNQYKGEAF